MDPDLLAREASLNAQVRAEMAATGDDGTLERTVEHYAYPQDGDPACKPFEDVQSSMAQYGFSTRSAESGGGIVLTHQAALVSEGFDKTTLALSLAFEEMGWSYDGWAAQNLGPKRGQST